MFVQGRHAGLTLAQFLSVRHPHLDAGYWQRAFDESRIFYQGRLAHGEERVSPGAVVEHIEPDTVEPEVDPRLVLLYEDAALVALHKPAPLPVHPCGRFNKNTVTHILSLVWPELRVRPVHRLDANTTGVLIVAKSRAAARQLSQQFAEQRVSKRYLVEVRGTSPQASFAVASALTAQPGVAGSRELAADGAGLSARTHFRQLGATGVGRMLLEAQPENGRTNQIRLHLASIGLPIVGDEVYRASAPSRTDEQALTLTYPIHLHAWRLRLQSPATGADIELCAPPPSWVPSRLVVSG